VSFASTRMNLISSVACGVSIAGSRNLFCHREARRSVHIALVAEVAIQYLTERQLDEQLALTPRPGRLQSSYDLNKHSFEAGTASELDCKPPRAGADCSRQCRRFRTPARASRDALVLLIGQPLPDNLPPPKSLNEQNLSGNLPAICRPICCNADRTSPSRTSPQSANANIGAARPHSFRESF